MSKSVALSRAPEEYTREAEQIFRRELETIIFNLKAELAQISSGADSNASLQYRTKSFIFDDITHETVS